MWDSCVELVTRLHQLVSKVLSVYAALYLLESCIARADLVHRQFAQGRFLCVIFHLDYCFFHCLYIADQLYKRLGRACGEKREGGREGGRKRDRQRVYTDVFGRRVHV